MEATCSSVRSLTPMNSAICLTAPAGSIFMSASNQEEQRDPSTFQTLVLEKQKILIIAMLPPWLHMFEPRRCLDNAVDEVLKVGIPFAAVLKQLEAAHMMEQGHTTVLRVPDDNNR